MRLPLPDLGQPGNIPTLLAALSKLLRPLVTQVNALSDGQLASSNNAATAPPTGTPTVPYGRGDFIPNSAPAVLGSAGSQYVILGWKNVSTTSTAVWVQCRALTGT